jgi:hypothetical protein
MKITILSHNLSSNSAMRADRLAKAPAPLPMSPWLA